MAMQTVVVRLTDADHDLIERYRSRGFDLADVVAAGLSIVEGSLFGGPALPRLPRGPRLHTIELHVAPVDAVRLTYLAARLRGRWHDRQSRLVSYAIQLFDPSEFPQLVTRSMRRSRLGPTIWERLLAAAEPWD